MNQDEGTRAPGRHEAYCVVVVVGESIRKAVRLVSCSDRGNMTLPEIVSLSFSGGGTGEFPVYFVLDVTHSDESGDNAGPSTGLHC